MLSIAISSEQKLFILFFFYWTPIFNEKSKMTIFLKNILNNWKKFQILS
jgi:hypothetical protein